jgi:hypothetical protein
VDGVVAAQAVLGGEIAGVAVHQRRRAADPSRQSR